MTTNRNKHKIHELLRELCRLPRKYRKENQSVNGWNSFIALCLSFSLLGIPHTKRHCQKVGVLLSFALCQIAMCTLHTLQWIDSVVVVETLCGTEHFVVVVVTQYRHTHSHICSVLIFYADALDGSISVREYAYTPRERSFSLQLHSIHFECSYLLKSLLEMHPFRVNVRNSYWK